jgi:hypothetical protein
MLRFLFLIFYSSSEHSDVPALRIHLSFSHAAYLVLWCFACLSSHIIWVAFVSWPSVSCLPSYSCSHWSLFHRYPWLVSARGSVVPALSVRCALRANHMCMSLPTVNVEKISTIAIAIVLQPTISRSTTSSGPSNSWPLIITLLLLK